MSAPKIVAEACCNHGGSMDVAHEMIRAAACSGAHYVKFQKRNLRELLTPEQYDAPHPVPENSYGDTYGHHREALEFDMEQHAQLMRWCGVYGTRYACSVFDVTSARQMAAIDPDYIKVPSLSNLNRDMLRVLYEKYGGGVHISLGMTTDEEIGALVQFVDSMGGIDRTVWYACTSGYPTPYDQVYLLAVDEISQQFGRPNTGFSGHHLGTAVDMAAIGLGASWIERHFTLDKRGKGTDNAMSLDPDELETLVRDARFVHQAVQARPSGVLDVEKPTRERLKIPAHWPL